MWYDSSTTMPLPMCAMWIEYTFRKQWKSAIKPRNYWNLENAHNLNNEAKNLKYVLKGSKAHHVSQIS